jgi:hypothetical protein
MFTPPFRYRWGVVDWRKARTVLPAVRVRTTGRTKASSGRLPHRSGAVSASLMKSGFIGVPRQTVKRVGPGRWTLRPRVVGRILGIELLQAGAAPAKSLRVPVQEGEIAGAVMAIRGQIPDAGHIRTSKSNSTFVYADLVFFDEDRGLRGIPNDAALLRDQVRRSQVATGDAQGRPRPHGQPLAGSPDPGGLPSRRLVSLLDANTSLPLPPSVGTLEEMNRLGLTRIFHTSGRARTPLRAGLGTRGARVLIPKRALHEML